MDNYFIWAQFIGLLGIMVGALSWQAKNPAKILFYNNFNYMLWAYHFWLLNAPTAVFFNILSLIKNMAVIKTNGTALKCVIYTYILFLVIWGVFYWEHVLALFPLIGACVYNYTLTMKDNRSLICRGLLFAEMLWIPYSLYTLSYMGALYGIIVSIAVIIGMIRHENWKIGRCYKTFAPSLIRSLFMIPNFRTYP